MPRIKVVFYADNDGSSPVLGWLDGLPSKVVAKCRVRIERLAECGHELRRPEADFLRDGVYELRVGFQGVNYRLLYSFHGQIAAVLTHGLSKERDVPSREIDIAVARMRQFSKNPARHTYSE